MRRRRRVSDRLSPIRIFIAHSSKDSIVSKRLAESLRRRGFEVWYDKWKIRVGDSIVQKISHALKQGDFLVAVLSKNSVKSKWVQKELSAALHIGLFVLPVRIDSCTIPILLRDTKYADFRKGFRQGFDELHDTIMTPLPTLESPVRRRRKRRPGRPRIESQPQIRKLVDSITKLTQERMKDKIAHLASEDKKRVIVEIMDRLSVAEYHDLPDLWYLFEVLDVALRENGRPSVILYEVFIIELASRPLPFCRDQLLRQVSKYVELGEIRQMVLGRGLIEWFVSEFEASTTFARGALNSEIIAKLQPMLTRDQIKRVVEAAITNNQIYDSWGAQDHLRRLFALCNKWLTDQQRSELQKRSLISKSSRTVVNTSEVQGDDGKFMTMAIEEAEHSRPEDDRPHPKVGVVVVKEGEILAKAHRGEISDGDHAEYTALERKLAQTDLTGATVYTTLEPCTTRTHPKTPCAGRVVQRRIGRVVIGMLDPNPVIRGRGLWQLDEAGVRVDFCDQMLKKKIRRLNRTFIMAQKELELQQKQQSQSQGERPIDDVPQIHFEITQNLRSGGERKFPDIGFNLHHLKGISPVRVRVIARAFLDGKDVGYPCPWSGYYTGQKLWNLNPGTVIYGHFTSAVIAVENDQRLEIRVTVSTIDQYDKEHPLLPVGWIYIPKANTWYFEP